VVGAAGLPPKNRFYIGEVVYRGEVHPGEQQPIVDKELFEAVQAKLKHRAVACKLRRSRSPSFLSGLLFDDRGMPWKSSDNNLSSLPTKWLRCSPAESRTHREQIPLGKYITEAGLIERPRRGVYRITERGHAKPRAAFHNHGLPHPAVNLHLTNIVRLPVRKSPALFRGGASSRDEDRTLPPEVQPKAARA
jgi:hypothetical protein